MFVRAVGKLLLTQVVLCHNNFYAAGGFCGCVGVVVKLCCGDIIIQNVEFRARYEVQRKFF